MEMEARKRCPKTERSTTQQSVTCERWRLARAPRRPGAGTEAGALQQISTTNCGERRSCAHPPPRAATTRHPRAASAQPHAVAQTRTPQKIFATTPESVFYQFQCPSSAHPVTSSDLWCPPQSRHSQHRPTASPTASRLPCSSRRPTRDCPGDAHRATGRPSSMGSASR